jgi:hypothetical protein
MDFTDLSFGAQQFPVLKSALFSSCNLFFASPNLLDTPYAVQSRVSVSIFRLFLSALQGRYISLTPENIDPLRALSSEFGFSMLSDRIATEDRLQYIESRLASLFDELSRISPDLPAQLLSICESVNKLRVTSPPPAPELPVQAAVRTLSEPKFPIPDPRGPPAPVRRKSR